jgi:integrase
MKKLRDALADYLDLRHRAGFQMKHEARDLNQFVEFLQARRAHHITNPLAIEWAMLPRQAQPSHWSDRLRHVRGFARYCSATEPRTQIPPPRALPRRYRRKTPRIHTNDELTRILHEAGQLVSSVGLRPYTFHTLIGLIAATGMRPGESVKLWDADVNLVEGTIVIRESKDRTRTIAIHASTAKALMCYRRRRGACVVEHDATFFLGDFGRRVALATLELNYRKICENVGVKRTADGRPRPRLHDLRHRFAIRTVEHWYRTRADVMSRMELLAAYLGHTHPNHTYWYLTATPELLRLASNLRRRS